MTIPEIEKALASHEVQLQQIGAAQCDDRQNVEELRHQLDLNRPDQIAEVNRAPVALGSDRLSKGGR